jgi:hypothetical protein
MIAETRWLHVRSCLRLDLLLHGILLSLEHLTNFQLSSNLEESCLLLMSSCITEDHVHILQRLASGLRDEEEGECQSEKTEGCEEDVCPPSDSLQHTRRDETNDEIAHPCRAGGNRHSLRSIAEI